MKSRDELFRFKEFQVEEKKRQLVQIETMITDFKIIAEELEAQIEAEHIRTGISDRLHFAYSTFAKAAHQRRDNLQNSIKDLETQMSAAQEALRATREELKKIELLNERVGAKSQFETERSEEKELSLLALHDHMVKG